MHPLYALPLLVTLLLSSVPPSVSESDAYFRYRNCAPAPYQCGSLKFEVDYPFSANGVDRPDYCSYPGYRFFCTTDSKLMIYMDSTAFQVTDFDYRNKFLRVVDQNQPQETCPDHYHNTTIDESRFMFTDRDQNLTVYVNCTANSSSLPFIYDLVTCISGGKSYYRLDNSLMPEVLGSCNSTIVVPCNSTMAGLLVAGNSSFVDVIRGGFTVRWKAGIGWCSECQASGGRCGVNSTFPADDHTCYCPDGQAIGSCSSLGRSVSSSVPESDAYFRYRNCAPAPYSCGSLKFDTDYPFSASGVNRPDYCSYTGYRLFCTTENKLLIYMNSTVFQVTDFDYGNTIITVIDQNQSQETCPDHYHTTTIDESKFMYTDHDQNLTVYVNCSANLSPQPFIYDLVSCLSGGRSYFGLDNSLAPEVMGSCSSTIVVLCNSTMASLLVARVIRAGFTVRWKAGLGWCSDCRTSGGRCGASGTFPDDHTCYCPDGQAIGSCSSSGQKTSRIKGIAITTGVAVVSGVIFMFLLLMCTLCGKKFDRLLFWRGGPKGTATIESFLQKHEAQHPKRYSYSEVKTMTKSFSHKLGQGGFGTVYMGKTPNGKPIAVKLLKPCKDDGQEFMNEVASISQTSHVNVVTLLGYCIQGSKRALIYEYMPNGSLERFAFRLNSGIEDSLSWEKMYDIAVGIARGLEYLHRGCNTRIVHFDIKPHNILLDQDFCPKISDFGLAKFCNQKESIISIDGARGTIGYIAPEVFSKQFGEASSKSDVYSYGMMILEMVGARKNINASADVSSKYFPQWIYENLEEYCTSASVIRLDDSVLVRRMIIVGLWCIQLLPNNRPSMTRVVEMLQSCADDLQIPPQSFVS